MQESFYIEDILVVNDGELKDLFVKLTNELVKQGTFYRKILIVNEILPEENIENIITRAETTPIGLKDIYFAKVVHEGKPEDCYVDSRYILCSSWTFPFIANSYRKSNNLYADCYSHRLTLKTLPE